MGARLGSLALATVLCSTSLAMGRDIFVSNTRGDDRFTGSQPAASPNLGGPVRTIGKALRLAIQGDRIVVENTGQPYRESISLVGSHNSGYSFQRFVIEGNGAVLDGSVPVPADAWEHYRGPVFRFSPRQLGHQQLFLNGRPLVRVWVEKWSDSPPSLEPLEWCLHDGFIYFHVEPMRLPEDYPLSYAYLQTGITLFHVDRVTIQDLTVQGFQLDGVNAHNSASRVELLRLTCRGNGRSGVAVGGASLVNLIDSLAGNNAEAQLLTLPWSHTHLGNTQLLGNTAPGWVDRGGEVVLNGEVVDGGREEILPGPPAGQL